MHYLSLNSATLKPGNQKYEYVEAQKYIYILFFGYRSVAICFLVTVINNNIRFNSKNNKILLSLAKKVIGILLKKR